MKCNFILVVHNDCMYDLTNMSDLANVSKLANLVILAHMSIKCWVLEKKNPISILDHHKFLESTNNHMKVVNVKRYIYLFIITCHLLLHSFMFQISNWDLFAYWLFIMTMCICENFNIGNVTCIVMELIIQCNIALISLLKLCFQLII